MTIRSRCLALRRRATVTGVVALCLPAPAVLAQAELSIANESGLPLMEVYASPHGADLWSEDLLGVFVVPDGRSETVIVPGADCLTDLRLVLADGRERSGSVDLCAGDGFRLFPSPP
jgi:hypothetical protein